MTSDPDIYRVAKLALDQLGEDPLLRAGERVIELLDRGDSEGVEFWVRIVAAIKELQRGRRGDEPVN